MVVGEFTQESDLLVIGGGPGGYSAAFRAAQHGISTTIVEASPALGGVCLHEGCIPSKTLLHVNEVLHLIRSASQFGIESGKPKLNLDKVREWKESVRTKLASGLEGTAKRLGVERIQGRARFEDSKHVALQDSNVKRIKFRRAIIATGSSSIRLKGIEADSPRLIHSTRALDLDSVPKSMLVIGGGYIGLELGTVYAGFGTEVTVVEMMPNLLPGADQDLVRPLARRMNDVLTEVCLETKVTGMKEAKDGLSVTFEGKNQPKRTKFDVVLVSVGRRPNTADLGLENTQVKVSDRGFIQVDEQMRTHDSRIYAIGDVVGDPMLAHKAYYEGRVCADVIAGLDAVNDARAIPAVVFTDPEIAWCGITEAEAKAQGKKVLVKKMPWGASGRAVAIGRTEGLTKVICDPETHRVLGIGICGVHAGEMIAEGVLAMEMGAVATDLASTIHPHPTLSEMMFEAAEQVELSAMAEHKK
jgi:dihydrolipoamide dehydrogenase